MNIKGHHFEVNPKAAAPEWYCKGFTLADVYDRWSHEKQSAYDYCKRLCDDLDGWGFCISSSNTFAFSVMFDFNHPETGDLMRAYITRDHDRAYYI